MKHSLATRTLAALLVAAGLYAPLSAMAGEGHDHRHDQSATWLSGCRAGF